MIQKPVLVTAICLSFLTACTQTKTQREEALGGPCEDCELLFEGMPKRLSWRTTISRPDEPGEPLIISGTIYKKDGKTPAPGVILYIYQTDNRGLYSPAPNQTVAKAHGHLRGWMKTDEQGRYKFETIRPGPYPDRNDPQHIHPIIYEPGKGYYWVDDYLFDDDPLLTGHHRTRQPERGGPGIMKLDKGPDGVWIGTRDIVLSF
ncbi:MAG: intradiol ring-cleavage dioxygenase [Cyclobacteriaceae bacterium]|nr:intradiol ring-cleavage dioxygenase [Cyclobacteriaceae bacterium]UYN87019.1 MAG: intradiol ring-cleavage dioxygenase [Cyclobacteriaceae bacterium]